MSAEDRAEILDEARVYVTKDRNSAYGEPEDNFGAIAAVWNAQGVRIDGNQLDPVDVALMMAGMKLARLRHNPTHRDSWVDAIGYLACGWDCMLGVADLGVTDPAANLKPVTEGRFTWRRLTDADKYDWVRQEAEHQKARWVSENRCGNDIAPQPHEAHAYGSRHGQWCDGYARVVPEH